MTYVWFVTERYEKSTHNV